MVKRLAVTLGELTTEVDVVSEKPVRWATKGSEARVPSEVLSYIFQQARAAGVRESRILAPVLTAYGEDGKQVDVPLAYKAWCFYAR